MTPANRLGLVGAALTCFRAWRRLAWVKASLAARPRAAQERDEVLPEEPPDVFEPLRRSVGR